MKRSISLIALLMVASLVTGCFGFLGFGADTYSVKVTWNEDMGNVVKPDNLDEIEDGTKITLKAEPKAGYEFVAWRGDADSTELELELVVEADLEIEAIFKEEGALDPVSVQVNWDDKMGNVKLPENLNQVTPGTTIKLVAEPAANHGFVEWKGEGVPADSTELTLEIVVVEEDMVIEAVFVQLALQDFEGYALGHEFETLGWWDEGDATVVKDPLGEEDNQVMKMIIENYNCAPLVPLTIPEGKSLADYNFFVFEGNFASGNVVNNEIFVSVYVEPYWVFETNSANSIGGGSRSEENKGEFSTEWETISIEIRDATENRYDDDGNVEHEAISLADITGDIYVAFSMHTTPVHDEDGEVIEESVFYADNVRFE